MRRALLVLTVLALSPVVLGSPVLAGQPTIPATPKAKPAPVLQSPIAPPSFVLPTPIPLAAGRPGGAPAQCKATCAKTLYFCQSGGDDDGCGGRWAQCNAACTATYSAQRFGR